MQVVTAMHAVAPWGPSHVHNPHERARPPYTNTRAKPCRALPVRIAMHRVIRALSVELEGRLRTLDVYQAKNKIMVVYLVHRRDMHVATRRVYSGVHEKRGSTCCVRTTLVSGSSKPICCCRLNVDAAKCAQYRIVRQWRSG